MLEATKTHENTAAGTEANAAPLNPALAAEAKIARIAVTVFPILVVVAGIAGWGTATDWLSTGLAAATVVLLVSRPRRRHAVRRGRTAAPAGAGPAR